MMRKIKIIFLGIVIGLVVTVNAQNIEQVYLAMPTELCPILSVQQRYEMLEYAKAGQTDSIRNRFGGWSELLELDLKNDYVRVAYATDTEFNLKLFHLCQGTDSMCIIGSIETVCAPICSSIIRFYNTQWTPVNISLPQWNASDFIKTNATNIPEETLQVLPPTFIKADFDKQTNSITFANETVNMLSEEEQQKYGTYLQEYKWKLPWSN